MDMRRIRQVRRRAFTLVELLIVIIIIAILSGMMMMTTGSASDSAVATKIINDVRNLKSAAMMYYLDNKTWPGGNPNNPYAEGNVFSNIPGNGSDWVASLEKYLDRSLDKDRYQLLVIYGKSNTKEQLIGLQIYSHVLKAGVQKKLQQSARDAGLFQNFGEVYKDNDRRDVLMSMR